MEAVPNELQWLRNMADAARENMNAEVLRDALMATVKNAPTHALVKIANLVYDEGMMIERVRRN